MASKVPKFGAWEGGENYTVYFDKARETRTKGPKINPNDPQENPDLFRLSGYSAQAQAQAQAQAAPSQTRADKQRKQPKVPHFGAWENEETVGYTVCFENARETRNGEPPVSENEPQMNRDMPPRSDLSVQAQVQAQAQSQARPVTNKPETKGARPKVPQFGDWENGGGGGYTVVFDNLKMRHDPKSNAPQSNRDVGPTPQDSRAKAPQFGAWEGGEAVQYTDYFENPKKTKNLRQGGLYSTEPQMNRDVGDSGRGPSATSSVSGVERQGRPSSVAPAPVHHKANLQPRPGATRGNQAASIPQFGSWNSDPSQAEGYTTDFARAKEDRRTPVNNNVPPPYYQHQQPHSNNQKQPNCCCIM